MTNKLCPYSMSHLLGHMANYFWMVEAGPGGDGFDRHRFYNSDRHTLIDDSLQKSCLGGQVPFRSSHLLRGSPEGECVGNSVGKHALHTACTKPFNKFWSCVLQNRNCPFCTRVAVDIFIISQQKWEHIVLVQSFTRGKYLKLPCRIRSSGLMLGQRRHSLENWGWRTKGFISGNLAILR